MSLKIVSWNVNGLRAILKKNFYSFLTDYNPDILCLQETKVHSKVCPLIENFKHTFFHHSEIVKGYSGTAILSKVEPIKACYIDVEPQHSEGRITMTEFKKFFLVNAYVPNSQSELRRLHYRIKIWDQSFREYLKNLQKSKPLIVCGDFNVSHKPIDITRPEVHHFDAGFTDEERASFDIHLSIGLTDVFRHFYPDLPGQFTWWSYRTQARLRNIGWRLDYFLVSQPILPYVQKCTILKEVEGSDHAPVLLELDDGLVR